MEIFLAIFYGVFLTGLGFCLFMLIKNEITFRNQKKIADAISVFANETGEFDKAIYLLHEMEDYDKTLYRLWDFECKNILPKEDYELIKPYIKKRR